MSAFLDRLRALEAAATPGPLCEPHLTDHRAGSCRCGYLFAWEGGEYCVATVHKASDSHDSEYPPDDQAAANGGLLVLLRNAAPKIAALVEAASAHDALLNAPWHSVPDMEAARYDASRAVAAALAALETP